MAKIKVVWYNVLRGFHKKEADGVFKFEKKRLDAAIKIISKLGADILFMGEGDFNPRCKITGPNIQNIDYKKIFDYPYVYYSEPDETSRKGEVILSKLLINAKNLSVGNNTFIKTWFSVCGKKINIDVIHPHPLVYEEEKAKWVSHILDKKKLPYILLGDFNALSPRDKYKFSNLVDEFTAYRGREGAIENAKNVLKCLMLKKVESAGLIDTYLKCNKKYSGTLPTKHYSLLKNSRAGAIRIDYIFCSNDFKVLKSGILKNALTEIASDHYPIYALLEI